MILDTKYDDVKRIKEIIAEAKGVMESVIVGRGHQKAVVRAMGRFNEAAYYSDKIAGIDFYIFVKELYKNFDEKNES